MHHDPEEGFAHLAVPGPRPEGAAEPPLVPAESALRLPPLAVHPSVPAPLRLRPEPLDHLVAVRPPDRAGATARRYTGNTVARMPRSSRTWAWWLSPSNAASPSRVSSDTRATAAPTTARNWPPSCPGPRVTTADRMRWVWQSVTADSFGHPDRRVSLPARR